MGALWSFVWSGYAFYDIPGSGGFKDILIINIVLGILFLIVAFIEVIGFFAALKLAIPLARTYAYLSILACVLVMGAESLRFSVYFTHKQTLIDNCTLQATGSNVETYGGFWGRYSDQTLSGPEAESYCENDWTRSVWSSVLWMFFSIILSGFFVSLAFSFYHQILSPQQLAPSQAYNMNDFQNQPYNPQSGYQYPAPNGPPPIKEDFVPPYDPAKVPDYYDEFEDRKEKPTGGMFAGPGYSGSSIDHV